MDMIVYSTLFANIIVILTTTTTSRSPCSMTSLHGVRIAAPTATAADVNVVDVCRFCNLLLLYPLLPYCHR